MNDFIVNGVFVVFSTFMSSDEVVNPEEVVMLRKKLISDVASINSERENLLKQLR